MNSENAVMTAIGLMSGTSIDGVDIALIRTDGENFVACGPFDSASYPAALRLAIRSVLGGQGPVDEVERDITLFHAQLVNSFMAENSLSPDQVAVAGFHGHTILHKPEDARTWQIGDGALLARETGLDVVCDMRSNDMAHGGQGAPLAPLFHAALSRGLPKPLAVLNIGGVANVTWIDGGDESLLAFDTGPGGAQLDEWVEKKTGRACDLDGKLAAAGTADEAILTELLANRWFDETPPKSLDRIDFNVEAVSTLSVEDGAATLTRFSVEAIVRATRFFPAPVTRWLVTGGGRKNPVMMKLLAERLGAEVQPVEAVGWNGDALEAQAFAYLAVRSLNNRPLSVPGTTGVSKPVSGGQHFKPA